MCVCVHLSVCVLLLQMLMELLISSSKMKKKLVQHKRQRQTAKRVFVYNVSRESDLLESTLFRIRCQWELVSTNKRDKI